MKIKFDASLISVVLFDKKLWSEKKLRMVEEERKRLAHQEWREEIRANLEQERRQQWENMKVKRQKEDDKREQKWKRLMQGKKRRSKRGQDKCRSTRK